MLTGFALREADMKPNDVAAPRQTTRWPPRCRADSPAGTPRQTASASTMSPAESAPLPALGGRDNYGYLRDLLPAKGTDVIVHEITGSGHYPPEERPQTVIDALTEFLG